MSVTIWFPPRLVTVNHYESSNDAMDSAVKMYLDEGIAIQTSESQIEDAWKVINFAKQFPDM